MIQNSNILNKNSRPFFTFACPPEKLKLLKWRREPTILQPNINNSFIIVTKSLGLPIKPSKKTADKIKKIVIKCKQKFKQTADKM